jgi:hypothetical protein
VRLELLHLKSLTPQHTITIVDDLDGKAKITPV